MKIVVATDSFKGSLSSTDAGRACADGILGAIPGTDVDVVAVGDGGEGTVDALGRALAGYRESCCVTGPDGDAVDAYFVVSGDGATAAMDMSQAAGLTLSRRHDPSATTTRGVGEMMLKAIDTGARRIIVGLGGSATNDGGMGMLSALGVRFADAAGRDLAPCGASLGRVTAIDVSGLSPKLKGAEIVAACDVDSPLTGADGATRVFARQKGADDDMIDALEKGMCSYARVVARTTGRDFAGVAGAGAAGGLGMALMAFTGATLRRGIDLLLDMIEFDRRLQGASLVITGEGHCDRQTLMGKVPAGVLQRAGRQGVPVVLLAGAVSDADALMQAGFAAVLPIQSGPVTEARAMEPERARSNLARTAAQVVNLVKNINQSFSCENMSSTSSSTS